MLKADTGEEKYCVYLVTNTINGKYYVGQTMRQAQHRWKQHVSEALRGGDHAIGAAIRKYGKDSFLVTVFRENLTKKEADFEEDFAIVSLKTMVYNYGYNLSRGGSRGSKPKRPDVLTSSLVEGYLSGKTIYDLASRYDMTFTGVAARLRGAGTPMRKGGLIRKDNEDSEVIQRYKDGETTTKIGKSFGYSREWVRSVLLRNNVEIRATGFKKGTKVFRDLPILEISRKYQEEGFSYEELGRMYGVTGTTIKSRLLTVGIPKEREPRRPNDFSKIHPNR